ncbi:MAG TPA: helix-turn-helix transcriptional regulator [Spirochaetales bacterium]|nr:helix-turn-helix transcriptional regulator [Spirochaetales bacterium]
MEIDKELGEVIDRIREMRIRQGLSQLNLAEKANISQSFLASLEAGKKQPSVTTVLKIAHALGVNAGDFFPRKASDKVKIKEEIITLLRQL